MLLKAFGRAIQADGTRAEAFAALGLAYDRSGQHAYAQRAYTRALSIDPERTATLTNYGLSQALSGNIDEAEAALRKAANLPDADIRVRQNIALVLGLQGKFAEMRSVDSSAPEDVVENNARILQNMIGQEEPVSTGGQASVTAPAAEQQTAKLQRIEASPSTPVVTVELGEIAQKPLKVAEIEPKNTVSAEVTEPIIAAESDVETYLATAPKVEKKPKAEQKTAALPVLRGSLVD